MQSRIITGICLVMLFVLKIDAQSIKYTVPENVWNADSLGNHRAVVSYVGLGNVAKVSISWRRRDQNPQDKRIIVQDAKTGQKVNNIKIVSVTRELGVILFEPTSGSGIYYVYYLPYKNEGQSNYPKGVYLNPEITASQSWLQSAPVTHTGTLKLNAECHEIQSIDAFNSFYPMEIIATQNETNQLKATYKNEPFLVFPEDRIYSIRMTNDLPQRWIQKSITNSFNGTADKGENYTFQLGIYALQNIKNIKVEFADLINLSGNKIAGEALNCINTNGITYDAKPLKSMVNVNEGKVQALWISLKIPTSITAGIYKGIAKVSAADKPAKNIAINITINNKEAVEGAIADPTKMTRLHWLNSTLAQENTVIAPYTPLDIVGDTAVGLLGRNVIINKDGFPKQIQTFLTEEMTGYQKEPNNLLYEGIHFHFTKKSDGKDYKLKSDGIHFTTKTAGTVQWQSSSKNDSLQMDVNASLEFDGFMQYTVKVIALQDLDFKDIVMHIPFQKDMAHYFMGLGQKGENRPDSVKWKWDVANKNQDGAWIGNVNAGLQFSLRDEKYVRPLNTNFYLQKPLLLPTSWGNENKGGVDVFIKGASMLANSYSGPRSMKKGDTLYYNFNLLITPFHAINTQFQWANRFYHKYDNLDSIKATSATVINIHHATPINPWINYPFIEWKKMKGYIDSAHQLGLKVKIYNTIRELSDHAYETFAMRSLGQEVYSPGKGGGFSWLQEHVGNNYIAAWFVPELKDAAIVNSGMNRWHNYYVEGMNWLTQKVGIDGIYLDDVAFDRVTMKRVKRVLTQGSHPGIVDLHSANQYNKNDGFNNSAMLYMEHFPYLNRLWFGEYFDYEKNSPDFFLTEVSGIPFGLMGEMLQGGGNAWRGMVYGMTNRMPWSDGADPRAIWKVWDDFGIKGSEMIGYWSRNCPVKTSDSTVLVTVYKKKGMALVSIGSWAASDTKIQLKINWQKLGIDPTKATIIAPDIKNFQMQRSIGNDELIPVEKNKGWLLIIKEKE